MRVDTVGVIVRYPTDGSESLSSLYVKRSSVRTVPVGVFTVFLKKRFEATYGTEEPFGIELFCA